MEENNETRDPSTSGSSTTSTNESIGTSRRSSWHTISVEEVPGPRFHIQVMDIVSSDENPGVPLESRCYSNNDIMLEPAPSASYTCRWVHFHVCCNADSERDFIPFKSFMTSVLDMMGNYSEEECQRVQVGLREFQRGNESKRSHASSFRPSFATFDSRYQHQTDGNGDSGSQADMASELPAFLSLPTVLLLKSGGSAATSSRDNHQTKTLLQYHYRFGSHTTHEVPNQTLVKGLEIGRIPTPAVSELWCLGVDRKNIITVSHHEGSVVWPLCQAIKSHGWRGPTEISASALDEYCDFAREVHPAYRKMKIWNQIQIAAISLFLLGGVLTRILATFIPGGWIASQCVRLLEHWFFGIDLVTVFRVYSFVKSTALTQDDSLALGHPTPKSSKISTFTAFLGFLGYGLGKPTTELALLNSKYYSHWIHVEDTISAQEGPPEEIFNALKRLWIIAVHFNFNFYVESDGHLYSLDRYKGPGDRVLDYIRRWFPRRKPIPEDDDPLKAIRITYKPRHTLWMGETLRDLETHFEEALANLESHLQVANKDLQQLREHENRELLRTVHNSGSEPALACMLRMCAMSTPTRFSITARDISDIYARKLSQQEWLMRNSVTQSLIYQISTVEDELRILKNVLRSQQDVISQVARTVSKTLSPQFCATAGISGGDVANASRESSTIVDGVKGHGEPRLVTLLKRKSQLQHQWLVSEVERQEDTVARLKSQAALLVNVKVEGQGVAIFVFTIVTIIFLPLSFATSYLGMNTSDIRNLEQGQWLLWAIGVPLTVFVVLVAWMIARRGPRWRSARQTRKLMDVEDWKWGYRD